MDTPLNKAHFCARKSLHYSGDEKIKYLEQAIENFKLALSQTSYEKAIDSIELQIAYYEKQLKLLNLRKCQKQKISEKYESCDLYPINEHVDKTTDIQLDLLRNLEESYNIIEELNRIEKSPEVTSHVSQLQNLNSQLNLMFHKFSISIDSILSENVLLRERMESDKKIPMTCNVNKSEECKDKSNEIIEHRDSDDSPAEEIQDLPPLDLPTFNLDDK